MSILDNEIQPPNYLIEWIECQKPLTNKLFDKTGNTKLNVLYHDWVKTDWWTKYFLSINDYQVLQRDIMMTSNTKLYWFARTIIPQTCYQMNPNFFNRLQYQSMKDLIYDNPEVQRINQFTFPITKNHLEYYWLKGYIDNLQQNYWLRLSQLQFCKQNCFYLMEIMFPTLEELQ